ncbi:MtN3 and saliva related transmembrane protein [Gillisia mitskevichiae]|uniref:MtN3 and saliva related transmembrane protein n=1 Tax=Gillisia mitskevichiae TaxID=270921 RepID=A0A495PWF3_9FLAO|nr:SemiSWEET transporter [Gillisia mitskevichiae]RKS55138.1 MtN3 and saliva related transmembrane protein [Gillisia mitskevichiae]
MEWTDVLGLVAGICTTVAVVPQIKKALQTKKVEDISPGMFSILIVGVFLWVVYGITQKDMPIIVTNGVSLALNGMMLFLMLRYREK